MDQKAPPSETLLSVLSARRDPRDVNFVKRFLEYLIENRLIDSGAAERAQQAQNKTGERIDVILTELGLISEPQLLSTFSHLFDLQVVSAAEFPTEALMSDRLSPDFLQRNRIVPIQADAETLVIAVADPFASDSVRAISYFVDLHVEMRLAAAQTIEQALKRIYQSEMPPTSDVDRSSDGAFVNEDDLQRLRDIASEAPVIRFVNRVISGAVATGASDIHIEPMIDALRVRYRTDGLTTEIERLPPEMQAGAATRIKILAKLNIAERRLPQDGRAKFIFGGREIDLRISTTPVLHGESIVIRILDQQEVDLSFEALGFDDANAIKFQQLLERPNGIILVTGPTGSGKTTTLYAALKRLNSVERTIFAVEDPIEYQLPGVNQMQIKPAIGLDFANCLRSILRQDPDVIMIGEIRDTETVRIGIQASLTGHLVLSTLHTNSAAATVTRLLDMGAQDFLLSSTLVGILAQRLVRKLCKCSRPADDHARIAEQLLLNFTGTGTHPRSVNVRTPVGCQSCNHTGFKGRTTILELLTFDDELKKLIRTGVQDQSIELVGRQKGMETLYECGVRKVLQGETSLDEVLRITRN